MKPSLATLPPAPVMSTSLTTRQLKFVHEYVERGGRRGAAADAAVAAGLAPPGRAGRNAANVRASEMLHNETVLRFLRDELTRKLNAGASLGVQVLMDLARSARSEQVRLAAARDLVDRGHMPVMSRSAVLTAKTTLEDLLDQLDAKEAAQQAGRVIEGELADFLPADARHPGADAPD